jgi:glyoxylase-like metal-dependent hydrolase (beta-lactamase superfamily II)
VNLGATPHAVAPGVWGVALATRTLPPWPATNAYLVGTGGVAWLVDPGAGDAAAEAALDALVAAAGARTLKGVLLTHAHPDHVGGLEVAVARFRLDAVLAHPEALPRLPSGLPVRALQGGRRLVAGGAVVDAIATPGHASDHLAFGVAADGVRTLIAGDLVAGSGSIWVGVPDGDVADYLASLERAAAWGPDVVAPGHGPTRDDGPAVLDEARRHRLEREAAVWSALAAGPMRLDALRTHVYGALEPPVADLADRALLAHLAKLMHETRVDHVGTGPEGPYARRVGG